MTNNHMTTRRDFLKKTAIASVATGALHSGALSAMPKKPLYKISLAQWSLNPLFFSGKMDNLEFATGARKHGIDGIEYVNQFFKDRAQDLRYLRAMRNRADSEGVESILIMCDGEGALGHSDEKERMQAVENHKKWAVAAWYLGCHTIRVNGYTDKRGEDKDFNEEQKLVADGLHHLCNYADGYDINVVIENHGGYSSNGKWLAGVIQMADHPRAGTLPDFGNFRMDESSSYDSYRGVEELMPYATGVSVKPSVWDDDLNESDLDYERMMRIVLDAGYRGYCGIEHGPRDAEWEGIIKVKKHLEETREVLEGEYA